MRRGLKAGLVYVYIYIRLLNSSKTYVCIYALYNEKPNQSLQANPNSNLRLCTVY